MQGGNLTAGAKAGLVHGEGSSAGGWGTVPGGGAIWGKGGWGGVTGLPNSVKRESLGNPKP